MEKIDSYQRSTYLIRLRRLSALRLNAAYRMRDDEQQRMIDLCIRATFGDCAEQGAAGAAASITKHLPMSIFQDS